MYRSAGFGVEARDALSLSTPALSPPDGIRKRESGSEPDDVRRVLSAGHAAQIDEHCGVPGDAAVVDARMSGHEDDDVRVGDRLVERRALQPEVRQRGDVWVVVAQIGTASAEHLHDPQRRRLARVADPALVARAEDRDTGSPDRL